MNETPTLMPSMSATEWAREHGTRHIWNCALDNYEPCPRRQTSGELFAAIGHNGPIVVVVGIDELRDATSALYLIDDGRTVRPMYVAAWHPNEDHLILHDFPTNYDENGTRRTRPDGRPVDFGMWQLGPRRTYHLKVRAAD